jgi:hypothetical protein
MYKKTSLFKGHRRVWLPPLGRGLPAPVQECKKGIYLDAPGSHSGLFLLPNSLLCSGSQCCKLHFHVALTPVQMKIRPLVENSDNDVIFFKLPNHNSLFRLLDAEPKNICRIISVVSAPACSSTLGSNPDIPQKS